jgi:hypothetical protein
VQFFGQEVFKMTISDFALPRDSSAPRHPEWKVPYRTALLETDPKKLAERVADAEVAILRAPPAIE